MIAMTVSSGETNSTGYHAFSYRRYLRHSLCTGIFFEVRYASFSKNRVFKLVSEYDTGIQVLPKSKENSSRDFKNSVSLQLSVQANMPPPKTTLLAYINPKSLVLEPVVSEALCLSAAVGRYQNSSLD